MISTRFAAQRGHSRHGWLDSWHSFSFADYFDPEHMGVSVLRVINDDTVAPGTGFGTHGHRDMEIISYVLDGALEHRDSMGNGSVIRPGEVQRMSAGSGVTHSEFNASRNAPVRFLQIWIRPDRHGVAPGYQQRDFSAALAGDWCLIASPDGAGGSLRVHQDARVFASRLDAGRELYRDLAGTRTGYLHVARGRVMAQGEMLAGGDALTLLGEPGLHVHAVEDSELLLFDLPAL